MAGRGRPPAGQTMALKTTKKGTAAYPHKGQGAVPFLYAMRFAAGLAGPFQGKGSMGSIIALLS